MSLYYLQKLLYQLNREPELQQAFFADRDQVLAKYKLDAEELAAVKKPDIGMLYILGVNGQILNQAWGCMEIPGRICLQSEGAEIQFKDTELVPLPRPGPEWGAEGSRPGER